jgi:hypothetical protein
MAGLGPDVEHLQKKKSNGDHSIGPGSPGTKSMGTFTMTWGRPPEIQPSTTLISTIDKPAWKADPKDMGSYLQF